MKRQRCRSEEYRARRWELKRARRKRRDPDGHKGVYTIDDATKAGGLTRLPEPWDTMVPWSENRSPPPLGPTLTEGETRADMNTMAGDA